VSCMFSFKILARCLPAAMLGMLLVNTPVMADSGNPLTAQPGHAYTLMQLTDLALSNNPQTQLAWAEIRSSQAGVELRAPATGR